MAGAIFASVVTSVLKILSTLTPKASCSSSTVLPSSAEDELQELEMTMKRIHAVLEDAEEKDVSDKSEQLRLRELKEVAYDAEDAVDEYEYEVLHAKVEARRRARATHMGNKYDKVILDLNSYHPKVPISDELAGRVKDIRKRFEETTSEWDRISLREKDGKRRCIRKWKPPETASFSYHSQTLGREDEKNVVIKWLLQEEEESSGRSASVLCIVGMGGLGKTTLAQMAYNDMRVCQHFDLRGWVYVSEDLDVANLVKKICNSFVNNFNELKSVDLMSLDGHCTKLKEILNGKKFFLVLDDVWNQKLEDLSSLKTLLVGVGVGKILITTRNERVAKIMQTTSPIYLSILSPDDSWKLFNKIACEDRDRDFLEIGKKIVKKCRGLPLAIKVLAGILRWEDKEETWVAILESELWELWELDKEEDNIFPVLRLSYEHLNVESKRCFIYLCLFPKGSFLEKSDIVQQWVSQGFILPQGKKMEEDVGNDYLDEFVYRSILQYDDEKFRMHDLIHDLAQSIAKDEYLLMTTLKSHQTIPKTIRHLSVNIKGKVEIINLEFLREAKQLRTLILDIDDGIPIMDLLSNLRCLRTLVLICSHSFEDCPNTIDSMKHLRYWDIPSHKSIPASVYDLHHLQTLRIYRSKLKRDIVDLINLRHLISYHLPPEVVALTNLQTLRRIHLGVESDDDKWKLRDLKRLPKLRELREVRGLETVAWADVTPPEAYLKDKRRTDELRLRWEDVANVDVRLATQVLGSLQPHRHLKSMEIINYPGLVFPAWLGHELPALKWLIIDGARRVKSFVVKGEDVCDGLSCSNPPAAAASVFPSLEMLWLTNMNELEEWQGAEEDRDLPCLRLLRICGCPKLRKLSSLSRLSTLEISNCPELKRLPSLPSLTKLFPEQFSSELLFGCSGLPTLRNLHIRACSDETLFFPYDGSFTQLEELTIDYSPELRSVQGLSSLASLQNLKISSCPFLRFSGCPKLWKINELKTLPSVTKLSLDSYFNPELLRCLPMLRCLEITLYPGETLIFPADGSLHPLEELTIEGCEALRSVEGLSILVSLRRLLIWNCPLLSTWRSTTEDPLLLSSSLRQLTISTCPLLRISPDERLPPNLQKVEIVYSPLAEKWYQNQVLSTSQAYMEQDPTAT